VPAIKGALPVQPTHPLQLAPLTYSLALRDGAAGNEPDAVRAGQGDAGRGGLLGRERLSRERKLGEPGLFSLANSRLGAELIALCKYVQGVNIGEGEELM